MLKKEDIENGTFILYKQRGKDRIGILKNVKRVPKKLRRSDPKELMYDIHFLDTDLPLKYVFEHSPKALKISVLRREQAKSFLDEVISKSYGEMTALKQSILYYETAREEHFPKSPKHA